MSDFNLDSLLGRKKNLLEDYLILQNESIDKLVVNLSFKKKLIIDENFIKKIINKIFIKNNPSSIIQNLYRIEGDYPFILFDQDKKINIDLVLDDKILKTVIYNESNSFDVDKSIIDQFNRSKNIKIVFHINKIESTYSSYEFETEIQSTPQYRSTTNIFENKRDDLTEKMLDSIKKYLSDQNRADVVEKYLIYTNLYYQCRTFFHYRRTGTGEQSHR